MLELPPPLLSVSTWPGVFAKLVALGLDPLAHNSNQIRPLLSLFQADLLEVDHVTMMGMRGTIVDFFATDVGKDAFPVARVADDQSLHFGEGAGQPSLVRIVEREALSIYHGPAEGLSPIRLETMRVFVTAPVKQKRVYI
jgi:hypothetical protein